MRTPLVLLGAAALVAVVLVGLSALGGNPSPSPSAVATTPGGALATPAASPKLLWPAPSDPLARTVAAGLEPAAQEFMDNHIHAHLDVFVDGEEILVPAGIGINIEDPEVKFFPDVGSYAGIQLCDQPCISPLHTHDPTGVLHTESSEQVTHTLGEFFIEWGVVLSETCVAERCNPDDIAVYVDGEPYNGNPAQIELSDLTVIVIVVGTPPAEIPSTYDFSNA